MKSVQEQLSSYKSVHFNKKNIISHFVGIPLIILAITILMSLSSFTLVLFDLQLTLTVAIVFFACVLVYYFMLHAKLALGMVTYLVPNIYVAELIAANTDASITAVIIFVLGWVIQFLGHYYEKAKPAFVDDLSQFLIGPFFLMAEVYFALGMEKKLLDDITPLARDKRRELEASKR